MIALVAAMGRNRVIGKDGKMPWHLPSDLAHFRRLTTGQIVVMGRKTFESIGRPLPDRRNVILSRDPQLRIAGCDVVHSIGDVLAMERPLYVIGGAEVYRLFLPFADSLYLTRIHADFEGDAYFPELRESEWELTDAIFRQKDERNVFDCTFETYRRPRRRG